MLNYEKRSPEYDFPLTLDRQKKLMELLLFFQKKKNGENYTSGCMVREICFWQLEKIDKIMAIFPKKKKKKKNTIIFFLGGQN